MKTISCYTLGCKVNQYDTEAMREAFERAGYASVDGDADIYLINTCTVTGTGDAKSLKLIRRLNREHPNAKLIVSGCLAQRDAERVALPGVALIIGVKHRARVVELYERAVEAGARLNAVDAAAEWTFEKLAVARHEGHTRAVMKIQEGCDRYCAYCVIPYVRGPVRSMALADVAREAEALAEGGYREIVLTGIHLASYGRGMGAGLIDAVEAACRPQGVARVRLGSLEPNCVTEDFARALAALSKVQPQFHLSLQSGSAGVLRRMRRRYDPEDYLRAVSRLRAAFPGCALTTDVLTGFPGETDDEARETLRFVERANFAHIHVFPYSRRSGTAADAMPDQVPEDVKKTRAAELIALGNRLEDAYVQSLVGTEQLVLLERAVGDGLFEGYTGQCVRARARGEAGQIVRLQIGAARDGVAYEA